MPVSPSQRLFNINIFTVQPGRLDEFVAAQREAVSRFGVVPGLAESRLFGAEDGSRVILMSEFDDATSHQAFQHDPIFQAERAKLRPLIQGTEARFYRLIHERELV